ncbi:MAG: Acylneuraminate cytidylyltransferase [Candidatus Nomurabacteria bacterium GW2011_GWA2_40_9]|uniref:Acylneuraminate cytidylyltransferase n=1 Tax=Candidatus Nomurabacteria bacterium GW2011_GWA2_40_9 TaxID=1618734 RepID=A0A0G0TR98_9BACT|nr:MAG: Acylneuraminate cytidylyltransferase [Candidatus Nomurabacteria bacterium GW2011_GWA2_40_9]
MYQKHKILGFIGARGGSKGIQDKNIAPFCDKPLIAWTMEAARNSKYLDRTIVSTDSPKIFEIAKKFGADVPFLRPSRLAKDHTPVQPAISHALEWIKKNDMEIYDIVVLLQPTSPLRTHIHIDHALEFYFKNRKSLRDTLVSVIRAPQKMGWLLKETSLGYVKDCFDILKTNQRQSLSNFYYSNGAIFITPIYSHKHIQFYTNRTLPYVMPPEVSIDIDTDKDFKIAKNSMVRLLNSKKHF